MASLSISSVCALQSSGASLTVEAQRLMALSVNKIVASRSRRGGVSLHRNLLVAGVLFRARDALLAAGRMSLSSSSNSSESSPPPEKQQQQQSDDSERKSSNPSSSVEADTVAPQAKIEERSSESAVSEANCSEDVGAALESDDERMDVETIGKENVPPPVTTSSSPTLSDCTKPLAETDTTTCDGSQQQSASAARKRRHSESSSSSLSLCPVASKTAKVLSSPKSETPCSDPKTVQLSISACASRKSTSSSDRRPSTNNPVVYLNRVDVAFCSSSGIGSGVVSAVRPVLVVQVV